MVSISKFKKRVARSQCAKPIISVAKWKKLIAKTVKTRERFRGIETSTSESSTIPGLELYDTIDGKFLHSKQLFNNKQTFYDYPKLAWQAILFISSVEYSN